MPEMSDRPVFGRSRASRGHDPAPAATRPRTQAGEKSKKGLAGLFPVAFCSDVHLGLPGRNSSGQKVYNKAFTFPERIQPKPQSEGKSVAVCRARGSGQSRGPPTQRGPVGTAGGRSGGRVSAPVPGARPWSPSPSEMCQKAARCGFGRKMGPNWEKQTSRLKLARAVGAGAEMPFYTFFPPF